MSSTDFHYLPIEQISSETDQAVSITFRVPDELADTFKYKQGQYLTLRTEIDGEHIRRAYSMCSSPLTDDHLTVTVKRVPKGLMSTFLTKSVREGDSIEVMPPQGRFFTEIEPNNRKRYYLFGAGSGITPLFSILKTVLEGEPKSQVFLLYGNRNESNIIYREQLDALQKRYAGQLVVEHILSKPQRHKGKGLSSIFSKGKVLWTGAVGRIDTVAVKRFLSEHPAGNVTAEYFICGPGGMIDAVEGALHGEGVDKEQIHTERFTASKPAAGAVVQGVDGAKARIQLDGEWIEVMVPAGKTLLDTLVDAGYDPPYSCMAGACSTCMAKVIKGGAKMDMCYALDEDEIADGLILTCQAHPTSDEIEITYEV